MFLAIKKTLNMKTLLIICCVIIAIIIILTLLVRADEKKIEKRIAKKKQDQKNQTRITPQTDMMSYLRKSIEEQDARLKKKYEEGNYQSIDNAYTRSNPRNYNTNSQRGNSNFSYDSSDRSYIEQTYHEEYFHKSSSRMPSRIPFIYHAPPGINCCSCRYYLLSNKCCTLFTEGSTSSPNDCCEYFHKEY